MLLSLLLFLSSTPLAQGQVLYNATWYPSGAYAFFTVPSFSYGGNISVHLWGGSGSSISEGPGGPGAYVTGTLLVTPGETLRIIVGMAGEKLSTAMNDASGGGGGGGPLPGPQGGGRSALQRWNGTGWREIVTAGGGGGGAGWCTAGGPASWNGLGYRSNGGASVTQTTAAGPFTGVCSGPQSGTSGGGGSQVSPGQDNSPRTAAGQFLGGTASQSNSGGGGGGFFGGGCGGTNSGPGGGGSSLTANLLNANGQDATMYDSGVMPNVVLTYPGGGSIFYSSRDASPGGVRDGFVGIVYPGPPCAPSYFCPSGLNSSAILCPKNHYCPFSLFSPLFAPIVCPVGLISPVGSTNLSACGPCPAGFYCVSGNPLICPRGSVCPLASLFPTLCPPGTANPALGASNCAVCTPGFYSSTPGSVACTPCPYATYGAAFGLNTSACSGKCTSGPPSYGCPPGSTTPAPILCPVNFYCPGGNPAPAIPCYPASACTTPGLSSQPPCIWKLTTLAGTGAQGFADGYGTSSIWSCPTQVTLFNNTFHILDYYNSRLRTLSPQPPYLVRTLPLPLSIDPKGMVQDLDSGEFYYNGGTGNQQIRRVNPSGTNQTLFAGNGTWGYADGAALTKAMFNIPFYMALLPNKDLVLADSLNCLIRRVSGGIVTTVAGSTPGFKDGPALASQFNYPLSLAPDAAGTLYVCDCNNQLVRSISPLGVVSTLAGSRSAGLKDGVGTFASFVAPTAIAYDTPLNALYIIENGPGNSLRRVSLPGGVVTTLVGGVMGQGMLLDGYGTVAAFSYPQGLVVGTDGAVTIADSASNAIRQATCVPCPAGFHCASGVPAQCPRGSFCPLSSLYPTPCPAGSASDTPGASSAAVCKVCGMGFYSSLGSITCTLCPAGVWGGQLGLTNSSCSGNCTALAGFGCPSGSTSPASATLCSVGFACPGGNPAPAIPCYPASACSTPGLFSQPPCYWRTSPLAGTGTAGFSNGAALTSTFDYPYGLSLLGDQLFIGDCRSFCVRALNITSNQVSTYVGICGTAGLKDGPKASALMALFTNGVSALADPLLGVLVAVADAGNMRARLVNSTAVSTVASNLFNPCGVFLFNSSLLFVVHTGGNQILAVNPIKGTIDATYGNGTGAYQDGPLANAAFFWPIAAVTADGVLIYVADWLNGRVRVINRATRTVSTLAGDGSQSLLVPVSLAFYNSHTLVVTEWVNNRVNLLDIRSGALVRLAGGNTVASYVEGFGSFAAFNNPMGVAVTPSGVILVADMYNNRLRKLTCEPCPAGFHCASGVPMQCPRGNYCPLSSLYPTPCPAGSASDTLGASSSSVCKVCGMGFYSAPGSMLCTLCPTGVWGGVPGLTTPFCSGNCTAQAGYGCPPGSTSPANATLCTAGYACPGGNPAPATPCSPATACTLPGLTSQPPCYWNVSTFSGNGTSGFRNGPPSTSIFDNPAGMAVVGDTVYLAEAGTSVIRTLGLLGGSTGTLSGVAGTLGYVDGVGTLATMNRPLGMAYVPQWGGLVVSDNSGNRIRLVALNGSVSTITGVSGGTSDGVASVAGFFFPIQVAPTLPTTTPSTYPSFVLVADASSARIRLVSPTGFVTTFAGSGVIGGADGPALAASFNYPSGVAQDAAGNVYVCERSGNRLRVVSTAMMVSTLVGNGAALSLDGWGTQALTNSPEFLTLDPAGGVWLYFCEIFGNVVRRYSIASTHTETLVGSGRGVFADGWGLQAGLYGPRNFVFTPSGAALVSDAYTSRIRLLTCVPCPASYFCASGAPVVCPRGSFCPLSSVNPTPCPGGSASTALGASTSSVCEACKPGSYSTPGSITCTLCPAGVWGNETGLASPSCSGTCKGPPGYGCPPGSTSPDNATLCGVGFVCPGGNPAPANPCSPSTACTLPGLNSQPPCFWRVTTLAGNSSPGFGDGQGGEARFNTPYALSFDATTQSLYVGDYMNNRLRVVDTTGGLVTTIVAGASTGLSGFADGIGTQASFSNPVRVVPYRQQQQVGGITTTTTTSLYVTDYFNARLRRIDTATGAVTTLVGNGAVGGADGMGSSATLAGPTDIVFEGTSYPTMGYIVDQDGGRIRGLTLATNTVTTLAGGGSGFADAIGTNALFNGPSSAAWHPSGALFIGDGLWGNNRVRRLDLTSLRVTTVAGNGSLGGHDGIGTLATFDRPRGVAFDPATYATLYVVEWGGGRIRSVILATATVSTIAGGGGGGGSFSDGFGADAGFKNPSFPAVGSPSGIVYVPDYHAVRQVACVPCPPFFNCSSGTPIRLSSSPTSSVSPTASPTFSPTPSSTMSPTPTASSTVTPTITPTASNTPPPFSCLSRRSDTYPCKTPSTALFPPKITRSNNGGSTSNSPSSSSSSSIIPINFASLSNASATTATTTTLFSSWPFVTSTLSLTFPISSSFGEAVSVSCTPSTTPLLNALQREPTATSPCTGSSASFSSCASLPSAPEGNTLGPVTVNFTFQGVVPIFPSALSDSSRSSSSSATTTENTLDGGLVTCTVVSNPLATSYTSGLPYPQYGLSTTLPPLRTTLAPFSLPLLAAVLLESSTVFGSFLAVGGGGGGVGGSSSSNGGFATFTLPPSYTLPCDAITAYTSSPTAGEASVWRLPAVAFNCSASASALSDLARSVTQTQPPSTTSNGASSGGGSLTAVMGGSRHVILVASPLTPFQPNSLRVFLGTSQATINWVLPGGALASITTPSLSALCTSLSNATTLSAGGSGSNSGSGKSEGGDCGTFPLILLNSLPQYLPIPSIYPPFQPTLDWGPLLTPSALADPTTPLSQASTLVGLPLSTILATTDAYTPLGTGIRIVTKCIDPTAAPPEECVVVGGRQPLLQLATAAAAANATTSGGDGGGKVCLWGSGDVCLPCPSGALCPGGEVLLPLPGYWAPSRSSSPSELTPCPSPDALTRCPGFQAIAAPLGIYGCGVGFKGQACAACDTGFYRDAGTCTTCPRTSLVSSILIPILVFIAGLVGFGVVALAAVYTALRSCGGGGGAGAGTGSSSSSGKKPVKLYDVAESVAQLLLWVFLSAQGLASLFTQAQAVSPPYLIPLFKAASALQFKSIAADPSCYSSIPFLSFWLATMAVMGALVVGGAGLLAYTRRPYRGFATSALTLSTLALTLGYGALTGIFSAACICTFNGPMTVSDYVNAKSDGRALRAALGPSAPSFAALQSASLNPVFASISGLAPVLKTSIPVSVLTSDPYQVCGEGAHAYVRPTAIALTLVFTAGFPALGLWLLWVVGRLKGCRRKCCPSQRRYKLTATALSLSTTAVGGAATSTRTLRPVSALLGLLLDPTLYPPKAWTGFFELWVLAVITGCVAVAAQSGLSVLAYCVAQGGVVAVSALAIVVLSHGKLYLPSHEWKRAIKCALYGVTGITAVFNGVLFALQGNAFFSGGGKGKEWLSLVPLLLGGIVTILLLVSWWRSLFFSPPSGPCHHHSQTTTTIITLNPMFSAAAKSTPWERHRDEDGDVYWYHPGSGESAWELPAGGSTLCGWVWKGEGEGGMDGGWGEWVHLPTGGGLRMVIPPPADEAQAEGIIKVYLRAKAAPKVRVAIPPSPSLRPLPLPPPPPLPTPPPPPPPPPLSPRVTPSDVLSLSSLLQVARARRGLAGGGKKKVAKAAEGEGREEMRTMFPDITELELNYYAKAGAIKR